MKKHLTNYKTSSKCVYHHIITSSHRLIIAFCFLLSAFCFLQTQIKAQPIYQLPNGGFEEWHRELKSGTNLANSLVPDGFSSFYSGSGSLIGTASAKRCDSTRDVRAGTTGTHSLVVYNNSVLGIRANGNVTTGRINAASMSAADQSNHNYTDLAANTTYVPDNPPKFCQQITGTPDSLRFWAKYLPSRNQTPNVTDKARLRVYIHGTGVCRDAPAYPSGMYEIDLYYGKATCEFLKGNGGWNCYQVPFEYNGTNTQKNGNGNYYVLISMTSNFSPGGGANGNHTPGSSSYSLSNNVDYAFYDDIEFVYSAWLTDIKINNVALEGFHKNLLTYGGPPPTGSPGSFDFPLQPENFTWIKEAKGEVTVAITNVPGPGGDADGGYTSILVTAEDGVTTKEYRVYYYANLSANNNLTAVDYTLDGTTPIAVTPSNPVQANNNITIEDPETTIIPQIIESSIVLADPAAVVQRVEQPTGVNSKGMVVVQAENLKLKTYNFMFEKVKSANSKLNWIKIANVDIVDFDADTLTYNYEITTCATSIPTVTHEKASVWATTSYTPASLTNRTATITVTAENGDVTVYKVNFILTNENTVLNSYRINSTNGPTNAFTAANNYTAINSAGYTAPFTLSLHSTAAQQLGCQGATVVFPSPTVWYPDTNRIWVTAQNLVAKQEYKVVVKNTNCYLKQTTGNNVGLKYLYNGVVRNITVPSASNNTDVTINVTIPVVGPNEPCVLIDADPQAPVVDTIIYTQPTQRAGNSGRVKVVANDETGNKTYIINFTPTISTDATLKYITYDSLDVPGFNPENELYTLIFPSTTTEVPELDFAPTFEWLPEENIDYTPAATLADTAVIVVTAENGTTIKTYRIVFEVVPQEKDAYLIDIRYDNQTIRGFNPTIYDYTIDIPYSNPIPPKITVTTSSPTALAFFAAQTLTPPYTQKVLVYSEDMTVTKLYTVNFIRVKNTNALLADIKINDISIDDFNAEEFEYEHELSYTELTAPVVTPIPAYEYATVETIQIDTVIGTVTITVTAEDDAFMEVYTIDFTRELSPVTDIETISYEYNNETYQVNCTGTITTIVLPVETEGEPFITEIVLADNRAGFEIEEQPDETNDLTGTVIVTAEDETEETYSIVFERTLSGSTLLTGLSYFLGSTEYPLDFHPDTLTYYVILEYNNSIIPTVDATVAWKNTQITRNQPSNPFGTGSILVISENGDHNITYTVVFQRKGNPNLVDLYYTLDGEDYTIPNFSPTTFTYNISLPLCTTEVPELVFVPEDNRCEIEYIAQDTPNGTSSVTLVTWNHDATVTYTVNFTVLLSTEALLDSLFVNGVPVDGFDPNVFHYTIDKYEYGTELPVVTGGTKYCDATKEETQINEFPGTATITVTAGNLSTNTYTVSFSIEAGDNTYLQDLLIDGVSWWEFEKDKYFYTDILEYGITEYPDVVGIPEDERSIVTRDSLEDGKIVILTVTALNGDVAHYQVTFGIEGNDNALAKMIYVDWKPLENFDPLTKQYTYELPAGYVGVPNVLAEKDDPNANGPHYDNTLFQSQIKIIAENGIMEMTYTITFVPCHSINSYDSEAVIHVYPNPSSNIIHFEVNELGQAGHLEIYSMEGKKIGNHILQNGINTINIEQLQNGIYFYKIFTDNTMIGTGKFIKN